MIKTKRNKQMNYFKYALGLACILSGWTANGQEKKAMTFEEMISWERITDQQLSENGKWIICKMEPWEGDSRILLYNEKGKEAASFYPAIKGEFSSSSEYLLVTNTPSKAVSDSLKLLKTAKDKMPMNSLVIRQLVNGHEEIIDSLRSCKLSNVANWLAYQRGTDKDSTLYIRSLDGSRKDSLLKVTEYGYAKKGNILYYISDSLLYTFTPETGSKCISEQKGFFKKVTFNENGNKLAYLYCASKDSTQTNSILFLSQNNQSGNIVANKGNKAIPENWVISENGAISFSENSNRLFFGTAPKPKEKDTTQLAEYRPEVQIWKWDEDIQYTQQTYNKSADLKKSYQAVYNISTGTLLQLADETLPTLKVADEGNASIGLLVTSQPYDRERMWTGRNLYDIYTINLENGKRQEIKKACYSSMTFSPKGNYTYWYNQPDSSWYSYSLANGKTYQLTSPATFEAWNEDHDVPDYPNGYGVAGWAKDDEFLMIKDRYDIWKFSPEAKYAPVNLTVNGRKESISYSIMRLDDEARSFDPSEKQYFSGFNELSKGSGYYLGSIEKATAPKALLAGNFRLANLKKAKKADAVIYTKETYEEYPDVRFSNLSFKNALKLTNGSAQQEGILWGTAELTSWISLDGIPLEGVIYKPANFDPNKKYPVIVNFYERNANTLYNYKMPEPGRSTLNYPFYISHEYIIFNPDVKYTTGYPGESCYNCVMPGITALIAKGYVNEKAIGAQGHSWGGYQVAYLATRTNLFAAIESGAPVVNMLSAYGGIRWGSGLNRSFQYEHGQSRIGGSIWDSPLQYIENSPLFNMNKVTTPILIMHNDADGHVPWYQGIEYFVALKRLEKPVWLLNYPGEPHWPSRMANRIDFQKRMFQFFDHYLKGSAMPKWMSEGVPAVDQDFELGY